MPMVIRNIIVFFTSLKSAMNQTKQSILEITDDIKEKSGINKTIEEIKNIEDETNMIIGDDGEYYESFNISDILHQDFPKKDIQEK